MAFWKKSEDPWDIDPEKKKRREPVNIFETETEPENGEKEESFLDELAGMFKKKPVEEEAELPPEKCPWCGRDMELGYLHAPDSRIYWQTEKPEPYELLRKDALVVENEGTRVRYKRTWHCRGCCKMVIDSMDLEIPEQFQRNSFFEYVDQWKAMEEREAAKKKGE